MLVGILQWSGTPSGSRLRSPPDRRRDRVNLVVLDACRDNPFAPSFRSAARPGGDRRAVGHAHRLRDRAWARGPRRRGRQRPLQGELLKALQTPRQRVEKVLERVRQSGLDLEAAARALTRRQRSGTTPATIESTTGRHTGSSSGRSMPYTTVWMRRSAARTVAPSSAGGA